jgi:NTP pyrophosphatase (non-canonical NTP hydrolase)
MEKKIYNDSIINMIAHWSEVFNLPIKEDEGFPEFNRISLAMKLIREELKETEEAIAFRDFTETKDGLGDLLWVVVRAMMELGITPEEVIKSIYESNMSKADVSQEDAIITYKMYLDQDIHTYCKERNGLFITYRASDHKVLKSHKFKSPEL